MFYVLCVSSVLPDDEGESSRRPSRKHRSHFGRVEHQRTTEAAENCGLVLFFLFYSILRSLQNRNRIYFFTPVLNDSFNSFIIKCV